MSFIGRLDFNRPDVSRIWPLLDSETRDLASRSLYRSGTPAQRAEADAAIAERMRFRPASVRKLPVEKRIGYVANVVHPDESLATELLLALHLDNRREILAAFLDALQIPNDNGTIDEDHELQPPAPENLNRAATELFDRFPAEQVELYLACLWAMDNGNWSGLSDPLRKRAAL